MVTPRIVLICGGRDFEDWNRFDRWMTEFVSILGKPSIIVHGDARGADSLARAWAKANGIAQIVFPANWEGEGKAAGFNRNQRMLDFTRPDVVVAFPGGPGTANMMEAARAAEIEVVEV